MPDLAGNAQRPVKRAPGENQPSSYSGGEADVHEVVDVAPGAEYLFAERPDIRVVVELDGDTEPLFELGRRSDAMPAGQDAVRLELARGLVDRCRDPEPDAEQLVAADAGAAQRLAEQLVREVEALDRGVIDLGGDQSSLKGSPARSQIATRMCRWPKSTPAAKAAPGTSESRTGAVRYRAYACDRKPCARAPGRRVEFLDHRETVWRERPV